jgi:hypothetical protein
MKCKVVRHHLLASSQPARPAPLVAEHLARCPQCRQWQRQLARIERLVPEIPVPPSSAKAHCLDAVLHSDAYSRTSAPEVEWRRRERAIRKVAITFAMAAGLLFFALVWYAWQQQRDGDNVTAGPSSKALYTLDRINQDYGDGPLPPEPSKRIERLAILAERLQGETKERVQKGTTNEVAVLARQFEVVVQDGILPLARIMPAEERVDVLGSIAEQLSRSASQANQLANQRADVASPLQSMAKAAQKGHAELRELARGKA